VSRETFANFSEALEYYRNEAGIRYPVTVEIDERARTATLRTGEVEPSFNDAHVVIWPAKNWHGEVEPVRVWAVRCPGRFSARPGFSGRFLSTAAVSECDSATCQVTFNPSK